MSRRLKTASTLLAAFMASTALAPVSAHAGGFKVKVKVKIDLRQPFKPPVQVQVPGNGVLAQAVNTAQQTLNNVARETGNVAEHAAKETKNLGENLVEAAETTGKFLEDRVRSTKTMAEGAAERMREGKFVDAVWHSYADTLKGQSKDTATAMQRSSVLRTAAQVATTAYGGPAGGAAFTVWLTYNATGSVEGALKAGAISYAASYAAGAVTAPGPLDLKHLDRIVANAAANGVVAGAASAAQGGDFKDAAITGAATSLTNSAYTVYTTAKLDMDPGTEPYSKGYKRWMGPAPENAPPESWNGDIRQLDPRRNQLGKFSTSSHPGDWKQEGSDFMRGVNKVRGMNAMAVLHDTASVDLKFPPIVNEVTIIPATIYTYYANGAGRDRELLDQALRSGGAGSAEKKG